MVRMRNAFSLIELIIVIIVSSIILSMVYETFFVLKKESVKSEALFAITTVKNNLENTLYNNDILIGTIIDEYNIRLRKQDSNGNLFSTGIYKKDQWNNLIKNTNPLIERDRISFLNGTKKTRYIFKLLPKSRVLVTSGNKIPYIDYWILMLPMEFYKAYKGDGTIESFNQNIQELVETNDTGVLLYKNYRDSDFETKFPILSQKISSKTFNKLKNDILLEKVSSEEIIRDKYLATIDKINNIAKNIQDWSSIQMAMYENVISNYGGSYNISYFHSLGSLYNSSTINKNIIFSSAVFENGNNLRNINSSTEGFNDIPLENKYSTQYGLIFCETDCFSDDFYTTGNSSSLIDMFDLEDVVSNENDAYLYDNNIGNYEIEYALPLISKNLFPGSKILLGINQEDEYTAFGDFYDIYISNNKNVIIGNGTDHEFELIQNVPNSTTDGELPSFGPYSLTFFTLFPWFNYGIDDGTREISFKDGIYYTKVFPELR